MKLIALPAIILAVTATVQGKKGQGQGTNPDSTTTTTTTTTIDTSTLADTVKGYIEAGTCSAVSATSNCGDDATGYYETSEYNTTHRLIIISGAPNHAAETDLFISEEDGGKFNPNVRCEIWQYSLVPLNPVKSDTTDWSAPVNYPFYGMGAYGYATSGGVFFDTRSADEAPYETAWDNEIDTLDTCMGHSNDALQYHYHGVPYCIPEDTWLANDTSVCQMVGYMLDGFPVYGRCQHTDGTELQSCWTATVDDPDTLADYSFVDGDDCYLDEANGYTFEDGNTQTSDGYSGYAYVTTTEFSGVPIGFMGTEFGEICGI